LLLQATCHSVIHHPSRAPAYALRHSHAGNTRTIGFGAEPAGGMDPKTFGPRLCSGMHEEEEIEEQRSRWRETSAAWLVAGLFILLLIGFGIFVAISVAPIAEKLPSTEATSPDGGEGDAITPKAKTPF
jgi:hypothetical protein